MTLLKDLTRRRNCKSQKYITDSRRNIRIKTRRRMRGGTVGKLDPDTLSNVLSNLDFKGIRATRIASKNVKKNIDGYPKKGVFGKELLRKKKEAVAKDVKQKLIARIKKKKNLDNILSDLQKTLKRRGLNFEFDRDVVIEILKGDENKAKYLKNLPVAMKNDKELVMIAVKTNGMALRYASEALRGDREVVVAALEQNGIALEFTPLNLYNDPEIRKIAKKSAARNKDDGGEDISDGEDEFGYAATGNDHTSSTMDYYIMFEEDSDTD